MHGDLHVIMKTEIPQDRQTGRLAREHSNRGRTGDAVREYGGPLEMQTEVRTGRCQIRGKQIGERQRGRQGIGESCGQENRDSGRQADR